MAKVAKTHTQYFDESHTLRTLAPGERVPKDHERFVKNPKVFAEVADSPTTTSSSTSTTETPTETTPKSGLDALGIKELRSLAKERSLSAGGSADAIRARIIAAEKAAAAAAASEESTGSEDDESDDGEPKELEEMDRDELVAVATELALADDFDDDTSEEELISLIENARS